ncbi:MAG: amino acid permease, partial [Clostridia bacterium]|nr:amino acid permease [Clostridia bacterium]
FLPVSGPIGTTIGIAIGALMMLLICINYHELVNRFPDAGGAYSYTRHAFGSDYGFLCAWFLVLAYFVLIWANATAVPLMARYFIGNTFQFGYLFSIAGYDIYFGEALLSIFMLVLTGAICILRKKGAAVVETILAFVFFLGILFAYASAQHSGTGTILPAFAADNTPPFQVLRIIAVAPWAFVGFEALSYSSEELRFPKKRTGLIMISVIILSAVCYILMLMQSVLGIPEGFGNWAEYVGTLDEQSGIWAVPTIAAAFQSAGSIGFSLIGITIFAALFSTMLGVMICLSRLLYALGRDGIGPKAFGRLNADGVPENTILFIVLVSLFIPFLGRTAIGWHVDISNIGIAIAFGYTSACAFKFAEKSLVKVTGVLGIIISIGLSAMLLVMRYNAGTILSEEAYLVLALWCILGFIFFRILLKRDESHQFGYSLIVWIALLGLIFFITVMWDHQSTQKMVKDTVDSISDYYHGIYDQVAPELTEQEIEAEQQFLESKEKTADLIQLNGSLIQSGLMIITLLILFSVYSTMRDRQIRIQNEKELANSQSRAKSTFLSNMSHDIRTPMNAIVGFTNLAMRNVDDPQKVHEYLTKVQASSEHFISLINEILEMSRIESGNVELNELPCSLPDIFHSTVSLIIEQVEIKQQNLMMDTFNVTDEEVYCDKLRLSQVLLNLLNNAVTYTPAGGEISVRLIQHPADRAGYASYEIRIKDNGIGMSPIFADRVFDSFEREQNSTMSRNNGIGLGLAITKRFVELMGGTISLKTAPGEGSEFTVHISFRLQDTPQRDWRIQSITGLRTLVVDADADSCNSTAAMLATMGLNPEMTQSSKDAVQMAKQAKENGSEYGLYLIDWRMANINGIETARRIRKSAGNDVPIVMTTSYDWQTIREAARAVGIRTFCEKPLFMSDLHDVLLRIFEGKTERKDLASNLPSYKGKRVLLVEDIEINRDVATMLLNDYQIEVDCVTNGQEAVERIRTSSPGAYDLIFMDIQMPVMNGYEATRQIRSLEGNALATVPIIAMTANAFEEDRQMAIECGMNDHIAKPIDVKILEAALKDLFGPGR